MSRPVGVLGSGSFGTAISQLLAKNSDVLLYCRRQEVADKVNKHHELKNRQISKRITATCDLAEIGEKCRTIFPVLPSEHFREVIKSIEPYVTPAHMMIHGTKGLDVNEHFKYAQNIKEIKTSVFTMSEVIKQETNIIRTGCLAGPNLAKEILEGQPAATVIASDFDEVVEKGKAVLSSAKFIVYGSYNLKGIELAGALKNVVAIASGVMNSLGGGKNMQGLLITRGLREMIHIAKAVGAEIRPFFGTAGIGDLIATATSVNSRNFTFGGYLGQGKTIEEIKDLMDEVAEGYRTINFAKKIIDSAEIQAPLTDSLYKIAYDGEDVNRTIMKLIANPLSVDVDFI